MPTLMKRGATDDIKATVKAYYDKLKADDSLFHWNSKQFKKTLSAMEDLIKDNGANPDISKLRLNTLRMNVKQWLDSSNRESKHLNNAFDNKRFNTMFALLYELDPPAAKEKFTQEKNITFSLEHGSRATDTEFFDLEDCVLSVQLQLRDEGHLRGKEHLFEGETVLVGKEAVDAKQDVLDNGGNDFLKDDPELLEMNQMKKLAEQLRSNEYFKNPETKRHLDAFIHGVSLAEESHRIKSPYKGVWEDYKSRKYEDFGKNLSSQLKGAKNKESRLYKTAMKLLNYVSPKLAKGLGYEEKKDSVIPTNLNELNKQERRKLKGAMVDTAYKKQKKEVAKKKETDAAKKKENSAVNNNGKGKPKKENVL